MRKWLVCQFSTIKLISYRQVFDFNARNALLDQYDYVYEPAKCTQGSISKFPGPVNFFGKKSFRVGKKKIGSVGQPETPGFFLPN